MTYDGCEQREQEKTNQIFIFRCQGLPFFSLLLYSIEWRMTSLSVYTEKEVALTTVDLNFNLVVWLAASNENKNLNSFLLQILLAKKLPPKTNVPPLRYPNSSDEYLLPIHGLNSN